MKNTMIKNYTKPAVQPMRPYVPGEDMTGISVSVEDTPELGGMIAIGADNGAKWYISKEFFNSSYIEATDSALISNERYKQMMVRLGQPDSASLLLALKQVENETAHNARYNNLSKSGKGMSFGQAVHYARQGYKIAREGWNGAKMFAYIVPAGVYPAQTEMIKGIFPNDMVPYREYWALKTAQDDVAMWSPSGSDSLALDWHIVLPLTPDKEKSRNND